MYYFLGKMKCRGYLDLGPKRLCQFFDRTNCTTPNVPPSCPVKEEKLRRPCYRYRCSNDDEEIIVVHTSEPTLVAIEASEWRIPQLPKSFDIIEVI
jgi:hypothetical protein